MDALLQKKLASLSAEERARLLALLRGGQAALAPAGTEAETRRYPLCDMQRVMWAAQAMAPQSSAYNVGFAWRLSFPYRLDLLERAAAVVIARHAVLRTVYRLEEATPLQTVQDAGAAHVEDIDATGLTEAAVAQEVRRNYARPFDLARGPVMRLTQLRVADGGAVLLLSAHHLALDLWSMGLVIEDLRAVYEGLRTGTAPRLLPAPRPYADFVAHQQALLASSEGERLWRFWSRELEGLTPALGLPTDRAYPPLHRLRGASHVFAFSPALTAAVTRLARAEGKTTYATLLAVLQLFLHQITGARDFVVGSPASYRTQAFSRTVGCMINFLPLRARLVEGQTFRGLLDRTFATALRALEHQAFPFGALTSRLRLPHTFGRPLLVQVGFSLESPQLHDRTDDGREPRAQALPFLAQQEGQFELYWEMLELEGGLHGALRYSTDLFDAETASHLAAGFEALVRAVVEEPLARLDRYPLPAGVRRGAAAAASEPLAADSHSLAIQAWWRFRRAQDAGLRVEDV